MKKLNIEPIKNPTQKRAKFTVNSIKQATIRILKEQGYEKLTTNKVAELALDHFINITQVKNP